MSNSSQQKNLPNTLTFDNTNLDDILKDCMITSGGTGCDTITLNSSNNTYSYNTTYDFGSVTLTSGAASPVYTISAGNSVDTISIDTNQFAFNFPEEWKNGFPEWHRVQDMCEKYP